MFIFEGGDAVQSLISEIIELRNVVKCSICLDIVKDPLQINCNHIFCADCINRLINEKPSKLICPICRKSIKRQRQKPNEIVHQLIQFVNNVIGKLEDHFQGDISALTSLNSVCHKINENARFSSDVINKFRLDESTRTFLLPEKPVDIENEIKKDAFDLLLGSPVGSCTFKKQSNHKTYTNKKNRQDIDQKLINFEDNQYRLMIIEWLCDNRNKFDRLTQTQSIIDDDSKSSVSSLDLPSMSQERSLISWCPKDKKLTSRRTRSLEVHVRQSKVKTRRNNSFSGDSGKDLENLNIEDADSDKDIPNKEQINIMQILEEKCLNIIDSQVMLQDKDNNDSKKEQTRDCRRKKNRSKETKGKSAGWTRLEKVNKSINRNSREMKKLCICSTSSTKLDKKYIVENSFKIQNKKAEITTEGASAMPVVLLNRLSSEYELYKDDVGKGNGKTYGLRDVESYIENNINHCYNIDEDNLSLPSKRDENAVNIAAAIDTKEEFVGKIDDLQTIYQPTETTFEDTAGDNHQSFVSRSNQVSNRTEQIARSGSIFSDKDKNEDLDVFALPTQKIIQKSNIDRVEQELRGLFSSPETIDKDESLDIDKQSFAFEEIDEVYLVLHQLSTSAAELGKSSKNNINVDVLKLSVQKLKSLMDILKNKGEITRILQKGNKKNIDCATQTEGYYSSGFKISSTVDFNTLIQHNVAVQTDDAQSCLKEVPKTSLNKIRNYSNTSTQTSVFNKKSIAVQTAELRELGTDAIKRVHIQANSLVDQESIYIASDSSVSSRTSEVFINNKELAEYCKENYQFTESMDHINFDTQTVFNMNKKNTQKKTQNTQSQKQIKKKLSFNNVEFSAKSAKVCNRNDSDVEIVEDEKTVALIEQETKLNSNHEVITDEPISNSTISFSLTPEGKSCIDNSLIKRFKRARALMEDCDDGAVKKLKKQENPYFMPQLSVEIISQAPGDVSENKPTTQNDMSPSMQMSTSLNYDEYLDRIMKTYEQSDVKTSTPKREPLATKQTKSQYIINKCNALIKEAASSLPASPPKMKLCKEFDITIDDVVQEFNLPFDETAMDKKVLQTTPKGEQNKPELLSRKNLENKNVVEDEIPFCNMASIANEFAEELQPVPFQSTTNKSPLEIKILQNVLLQNQNVNVEASKLQYNLEDEWRKMEENIEQGSQTSEEVFSDTDVDVVETTPQKDKSSTNKFFLSLSLQNRHTTNETSVNLPPTEDSPDVILATDVTSYLNKTFDPPSEFQDCNPVLTSENRDILWHLNKFDKTLVPLNDVIDIEEDSNLDNTLVNIDKEVVNKRNKQRNVEEEFNSSLTSNCKKSTAVKSKGDSKQSLQSKLSKSNEINTLNFLPVEREMKDLNPIERTLKSNYSPLEIVPAKSRLKKAPNLFNNVPTRQGTILNYVNSQTKSSQQSTKTMAESFRSFDKPCISCTRLSREQVIAISSLTNKRLATYSNTFNNSVTHMIVSVNEKNCIQDHTMKFISAVAAGIWILSFKWVQECLAQNKIVSEDPFEALDVSGVPGPKTSRLMRLERPLLKGFVIHAAPPFISISKPDLENVIHMLGGKTVSTLEALGGISGIRLIVTEAKQTQDFEIYETWLERLKVVTVDVEWLSRSVGQFQLLSLKPFSLCSDDNIADLGYPEELLVDTPFSFSQSMYSI